MNSKGDLVDSLFRKFDETIQRVNKLITFAFLCMDVFYMIYNLIIGVEIGNAFVYFFMNIVRPLFYSIVVLVLGDRVLIPKFKIRGSGVLLVTSYLFGIRIYMHSEFGNIYTLMVIPLFLALLYGSKELVDRLFYQGLMVYGVVSVFMIIRWAIFKTSTDFFLMFVGLVTFICCYFCVKMFVTLENSKEVIIDKYRDEYNEISKDARTDGLTRLWNFKTLSETAEDWIKTKDNVMFCIIDIDNFKKVNDTYGHEFGNVVLRRLSLLLSYRSKENVFVARYGGEEFGVLTYGMNLKGMYNMMEKLRRTFRLEEYRETRDNYSFSGGIAIYRVGMSAGDLFEAADKKLYDAKHNGKNQIRY